MGQRLAEAADSYAMAAAYTLRMNEIVPQPYAHNAKTTTIDGLSCGEYKGVPVKMIEWDGPSSGNEWEPATTRRLYLVTTWTDAVRIYMLRADGTDTTSPMNAGWWLWKEIAGFTYSDIAIIGSELWLMGVNSDGTMNMYKARYNTGSADNWVKTVTSLSGDLYQHAIQFPTSTAEATFGSIGPDLYRGNDKRARIGAGDTGNNITALIPYNGMFIIIKPEGIFAWHDEYTTAELKINLRGYFNTSTGSWWAQWGQLLYFNIGPMLASFDGEKMVIEPPVYGWADEGIVPQVDYLANCGEALGVAFDGMAALYDGRDWHNLYRMAGVRALAYTTSYKEANQRNYPMGVACQYPDAGGTGKTSIFEFSKSLFRPLMPDTTTGNNSWLISSAIRTDNDTTWNLREMRVRARHLSATLGIRVRARMSFRPDDDSSSWTTLCPTLGAFGSGESEGVYTFTTPEGLTGNTFQYKVRFLMTGGDQRATVLPVVSEVDTRLVERPTTPLRRFSYQFILMDEYEMYDGTTLEYDAHTMMRILWEAHYQEDPPYFGLWNPLSECWVEYPCSIRILQHSPYADENGVIGYIVEVAVEELP